MRALIVPAVSITALGAAAAALAAGKLGGPSGQPAPAPAAAHQAPAPSPPPDSTQPEPAPAQPAPAPDDPRRAAIERDLALDVALGSPRVVELGEPIDIAVTLRNTSRDRAHPIVLPGDGSEVGWREPHVYFTAEIDDGDGTWRPVPEAQLGRCGVYDHDWAKDVVVLAPGEARSLSSWLGYPQHQLAFSPGTVRLTVHYAYRPSASRRPPQDITFDPNNLVHYGYRPPTSRRSTVESPPAMAGVPDFELRSEPVVFQIVRTGARP